MKNGDLKRFYGNTSFNGDFVRLNSSGKIDSSLIDGGTGSGKTWRDVEITTAELNTISDGGNITKVIETYDPTNFKNDYFRIKLNNTGTLEGKTIYEGDNFSYVCVDVQSTDWYDISIRNILMKAMDYYGFFPNEEYTNYYKTIVLYAGCNEGEYVFEGSLLDKNVIYVQDVSQQKWEGENVVVDKKESLEREIYGNAYVLSMRGGSFNKAIMFVYEDSKACYWDNTTDSLKWTNVSAGKVYWVTSKPDSDTGRWILDSATASECELTAGEKAALLNDGVEFETGKVAASTFYNEDDLVKTECIGNGDKELIKLFSWNTGFSEPTESHYLEFLARPSAILLDSYTYEDEEGQTITEEDGEYVWYVNVEGTDVILLVPKGNLTSLVISINEDKQASYGVTTLFRHTFRINHLSTATIPDNDYKLNITFSAVNAQMGDSSIEYILHSDENYQFIDWMLPVTGKIGKVVSGAVETWYDAYRIIAGWDDTYTTRTLYVCYIDSNGDVQKVAVITDSNKANYEGTDYRSEIGNFLAY